MRNKNLFVGIDAYEEKYTMDVINKVDLVVVFRDIVNKYEKNCQTGQWNSPFCRQNQLTNQLIADMKTAAGFEPSKFVSMIFKVNSENLSGLIEKHFQGDFPGGIFVSDKLYADATGKPSFFDKLSDITGTFTTGMKVRSGNCGCNDIDECSIVSICPSNAQCSNTVGSFDCKCDNGYETILKGGITACIDIDECISPTLNTCDAIAACINIDGSFECKCPNGYSLGADNKCVDQNECLDGTGICQENAECVNNSGGYSCQCVTGWIGTILNGVSVCIDVNECGNASDNNCDDKATCTNNLGSYTCKCNTGYIGGGLSGDCKDINECSPSVNTHKCDQNANCLNTAGSYNCNCNTGFTLTTDTTCSDIDECDNTALNQCDVNASCTNSIPGYSCTCNDGFLGNGFDCVDRDECVTGIHDCHVMADCVNNEGSYTCHCVDDWDGNGRDCTQDLCSLCDSTATCINDACVCPAGQAGTGLECVQNQIMVPIQKAPLIHQRSSTCQDPYWLEIAQNDAFGVILNLQNPSWLPCIEVLASAGVEIYGTIDAKKNELSNNVHYLKNQMDNLLSDFNGAIGGALITNPNEENGFKSDYYSEIFAYAKSIGLKVGIEGYYNKFDLSVVNLVDHVVLFRDVIDKYRTRCNTRGKGPFCRQWQLEKSEIEEIQNAVTSKLISADKFSTMVFDTTLVRLDNVVNIHYNQTMAGGLFVTERSDSTKTHKPEYWDTLVSIVRGSSGRSGADCGCKAVDECADNTHNCPSNSNCVDTEQGFGCTCIDGYRAVIDNTGSLVGCVDINECDNGSNECSPNADCTNNDGSYVCTCHTGYSGNGKVCNDKDECTLGTHICHTDANCINSSGSHICQCKVGYLGDGLTTFSATGCIDVDECTAGGHLCVTNAKCINLIPSHTCECLPGFDGSGFVKCEDIDECANENTNDCHSMATCTNTIGSYTCECLDGLDGDGINACESNICNVCADVANCIDDKCVCPPGSAGTGIKCSRSNMMIPISKSPELSPGRALCTDPYWIKIAELQSVSIIVGQHALDPTWRPCLDLVSGSGVTVYATLNAHKESLMGWKQTMKDRIDEIVSEYGTSIGGIYFINPSKDLGFTNSKYSDVFSHAKSVDLAIGIDGTGSLFDMTTVNDVDHVVIFNGLVTEFLSNCGSFGQGPFCSGHESISDAFIQTLADEISNGNLPSDKFSSMIFATSFLNLVQVVDVHFGGAFPGGLFVSDQSSPDLTMMPSYFEMFANLITAKAEGADKNLVGCGCYDIDECLLSLDTCEDDEECVNVPTVRDSRGYTCQCADGYKIDTLTATATFELNCIDIDECTEGLASNCGANSECLNNDGSYTCPCVSGFNLDPTTNSCKDINECVTIPDACLADELCLNSEGSFTCEPAASPTNNECASDDLNDCSSYPNSHCVDVARRVDSRGFKCFCDPGYECKTCVHLGLPGFFSCEDIDECANGSHTCDASATCSNTPGSFDCNCDADFELDTNGVCIAIDKCTSNLHNCPDNSMCEMLPPRNIGALARFSGAKTYSCACLTGYKPFITVSNGVTSLACADEDECVDQTHSCTGGQTCVNNPGSYDCVNINCAAYGCSDTCKTDVNGAVVCTCLAGMELGSDNKTCKDVNECLDGSAVCSVNADCVNTSGAAGRRYRGRSMGVSERFIYAPKGYECNCKDGYEYDIVTGSNCVNIDECATGIHDCIVDSETCIDTPGGFDCIGSDCAILGCSHTCTGGAKPCTCPADLELDSDGETCVDINECLQTNPTVCPENSTCTNKRKSEVARGYECTCNPGYSYSFVNGIFSCVDTNECLTDSAICPENSYCSNEPPSTRNPRGYYCICNDGYRGTNVNGALVCADINECADNTHTCANTETCVNTVGGFSCADKNECQDNNLNVCDAIPNSHCINAKRTKYSPKGYYCICNTGFQSVNNGNGLECVEINDCESGLDQCPANSYCTDVTRAVDPRGYKCFCEAGYTYNPGALPNFECIDIDECKDSNACAAGETCVNGDGTFDCVPSQCANSNCSHTCKDGMCTCPPGMTLGSNWRDCVDIDECSDGTNACPDYSDCINTRMSARLGNGYQCKCKTGYTYSIAGNGDFSCIDINECDLNTNNCQQDEGCVNTPGSYTCNPIDNSDNDECSLGIHQCPLNSYCTNTFRAIDPRGYKCFCNPGYTGVDLGGNVLGCNDIDECSDGSANCAIDEVCINTQGGFTCNKDICTSLSCSHDCTNTNPIQCTCPYGMYLSTNGRDCLDLDECLIGTHSCDTSKSNCQDRPVSVAYPLGYTCECNTGYESDSSGNCININECVEGLDNCNDATEICADWLGTFTCEPLCTAFHGCSHGCTNGNLPCTCPDGYSLATDGKTCADDNECTDGSHTCVENSVCFNTSTNRKYPKGYQCNCDTGYTPVVTNGGLDSTGECVDINECDTNNHNCAPGELCFNTIGGFVCNIIDPCDTLGCSHVCDSVTATCSCPEGMELDPVGTSCQLIDEEVEVKCESNHMEVLIGKKYFESSDGFQLSDPNCNVASKETVEKA